MSDPRFKPSQPEIEFPDRLFLGIGRAYDYRGCAWDIQVDSNGKLTVRLWGSKSPSPRSDEFIVTDMKCSGTPSIVLDDRNKTMAISCPLWDGGKLNRHCLIREFPDPSLSENPP